MKIGLVLERLLPSRGGLEQWTGQFAKYLVELGHEVHVVAKQCAIDYRDLGVVCHPIQRGCARLGFARAAEEKLRSLRLDLIHDMGAGWYCDVFHPHGGSWLSARKQHLLSLPKWTRPVKRILDPLLPRYRQHLALRERQYEDRGQVFIAVSKAVADDLEQFHGIAPDQIRVVYNGIHTDRFSPVHRNTWRNAIRQELQIDNDVLLTLTVAHNLRLKGVGELLRTIRILAPQRDKFRLVVVGGKRLRKWRRLAARLGVTDMVTFVGATDDPVPYYAAADVLLHPTFYDTCALTVLEGAAAGLPVVTTTQCNGVSELLTDGVDGFLIPGPTDGNQLADRIRRLLDPSIRRKMSVAARRMSAKHTFDRNAREILAVYEEISDSRVVPFSSRCRRLVAA